MKSIHGFWVVLAVAAGLTALASCAVAGVGIRRSDVAGEPGVYCSVVREPNPLLAGGWKANFMRLHDDEPGGNDANYVQFWLEKRDGGWALYFYRTARSGKKRYVGWKDWTIAGDQMTSANGVRIFVQDGGVYFSLEGEAPVRMERAPL
ncbi:MAG: hypothetical protein AB7W37_00125 [Syntrophobacteraceae bacterium]|jgi:hypothetical protein